MSDFNKLAICQFSGSTERPPQIAIHSSGSYSIVFFPTQPEAASQKNPNTLKVLLETARLASVLPIAPPRKITGPIQVQHLQIVWGVLQTTSSLGWKTCAANWKSGSGDNSISL